MLDIELLKEFISNILKEKTLDEFSSLGTVGTLGPQLPLGTTPIKNKIKKSKSKKNKHWSKA